MTLTEIKIMIVAMLLRFDALTDEDKAQIKQMCKDAGIKATFRKTCANCYQDALLLLKLHYGVKIPDADIVTPSGHFVYHNGMKKVVWWWRHNYYELSSQSDDATIEKYMAVHPSQTHYSRVEKPEPEPTDNGENATENPDPVIEGENGTQGAEQTEGGVTEQDGGENVAEGEKTASNEGENGEGEKVTEGDGNETNE